ACRRGWQSPSGLRNLLAHQELHPAVLRPAGIATLGAQGVLLAVAPDADPRSIDAVRDESVANGGRPTLTEGLVVLRGAALVGKTFEQELIAVGLEPRSVGVEYALIHGPDHRAIQVEVQILESRRPGLTG